MPPLAPFGSSPPVPGSPSPPGLSGESDEDLWSESGESEVADPLGGEDGDDDDSDFVQSRSMSHSRTRLQRTSSVSGNGARASNSARLGVPVPVPNLTKKSRGRRVPTAPVFMVQGGVQKNMRMYRCTVDGCHKCFARGEHLKRHVRSIHTNEKREYFTFFFSFEVRDVFLLQRTSVLSRDAGRISVVTKILGSTCAYIRVKASPATHELLL